LVRYPDDQNPTLWQERVLLAESSPGSWIAVTPDEELVKLDLLALVFRVMSQTRDLPAGVKEQDCYLVYRRGSPGAFYRGSELTRLRAEAEEMIALEGRGRPVGLAVTAASSAVPAVEEPAAPAPTGRVRLRSKSRPPTGEVPPLPPPQEEPPADPSWIWVTIEPLQGTPMGTEALPPDEALLRGDSGLSRLPSGRWCA